MRASCWFLCLKKSAITFGEGCICFEVYSKAYHCHFILIICIQQTVTWASWRLESPVIRLFDQPFVQANNKGSIKVLHHWPFARSIHRLDSPHKGTVIQKAFPCHGISMNTGLARGALWSRGPEACLDRSTWLCLQGYVLTTSKSYLTTLGLLMSTSMNMVMYKWLVWTSDVVIYVEMHKSHNVPVPYPTMHHSEQKCAHFCSEWCIVEYEADALWISDVILPAIDNHQAEWPVCTHHSVQKAPAISLPWRHNECDGVSNHRRLRGLLSR